MLTKSQLIAALADVPDDAPVVLDMSIESFMEVVVEVDPEGVRICPDVEHDGEAADAVADLRSMYGVA